MIIEIEYKCGIPPWQQIADGLAVRILTGTLAAGQALLSVKELSLQLKVNPNTVERAYEAVRTLKLLRANAPGRWVVVPDEDRDPAALGSDIVSRSLQRVITQARQLGLSAKTLEERFQELMREYDERDS